MAEEVTTAEREIALHSPACFDLEIFMQPKRKTGWLLIVLVLALPSALFAHGDEDHGDKKSVVVAGTGMIARIARVGDYEVLLKHPVLEPLHEQAARIFITRYTTNEAVNGAAVNLVIAGKGQAPSKVTAKAAAKAGEYEITLPPLDVGAYNLTAEITINGTQGTASYGAVAIESPQVKVEDSSGAGWLTTLWRALGVLLMALIGVLSYRVWHRRAILQPEG